jgi:ribose-phosphate pyrophosphokinase
MTIESGMSELTTTLPGLETASEPTLEPEAVHGHFIERGPSKRLMLFSGRSHPVLAEKIAERIGVELGAVELRTFANGETYCRYEESIRGADVFLVQTGCEPVDRNLFELLVMIDAARLASAKRITAVLPWFPYSRQDKKSKPREPITGKLVADILQVAGADRVLTMDLHAGQIQGFFRIPVDHMTALPLFAQYYRDKGFHGPDVVAVSPDLGRARMAGRFAELLDSELAFMNKTRPAPDVAAVTEVIGRVRGQTVILSDDMIVTGGSLIAAADALLEAGAKEVYACATHGLLPGDAFEQLQESQLTEIAVSDTVPIDPVTKPEKIQVLSVSEILAKTILNVFEDESVSGIFPGGNQLF